MGKGSIFKTICYGIVTFSEVSAGKEFLLEILTFFDKLHFLFNSLPLCRIMQEQLLLIGQDSKITVQTNMLCRTRCLHINSVIVKRT
jgi:hypothetical protein